MKKKSGYTLFETIIVMAIISVLSITTLSISKSFKNIINEIKAKSVINEIANLLSYSKYYCRRLNVAGSIEINQYRREAIFIDDDKRKTIKSIILPMGFNFKSKVSLKVNKVGHMSSDTIRISDDSNNLYKITISTGVDTVNLYYGE